MPLDARTDLHAKPLEDREEELSPTGYLVVQLTPDQRQELSKFVKDHLDTIEQEMGATLQRFDQERNQLEGNMPGSDHPYPGAFRVAYPVTKRKTRDTVNRAKQAYLDSDPIWAIDTTDVELVPYAMKVEAGLNTVIRNEIQAEDAIAQALFESGLHGAGFLVPDWLYQEESRRGVESYTGFDGVNPETLTDLMDFEQKYPDWKTDKEARHLHTLIAKGGDVTREVTYTHASRNHPTYRFIECKKVRAYSTTNGFAGLATTPVYGYVETFTRDQLRRFADSETIDEEALDEVIHTPEESEQTARDQTETHEVFLATVTYSFGEHTMRYKVWLERKSGVLLRTRAFPWWYGQPDLIPFYLREEDPGFFKRGLAWDLFDDHVALTVLLNLYLNALDLANAMQFKGKAKSLAEQYILSKRWSPHIIVPWKDNPNEIETFPKQVAHIPAILGGIELMRRTADEDTSTSALQSGRESPMDPRAPARKAELLLQQVEPNMKEHLRSLEKGFRELGKWTLWLYYQGIALGWIEGFPGVPDVPHELLPKLAEKLMPRALLFESDRQNRLERNIAVMKIVDEHYPPGHPARAIAVKTVISQMSSDWSRMSDKMHLDEMPQPQAPPGQPAQPGMPPTNGAAGRGVPPPQPQPQPAPAANRLTEMAQARA